MDRDSAKRIMREMEQCFTEVGLPILREGQGQYPGGLSEHLAVCSNATRNGQAANIVASIFSSNDTVVLSMRFQTLLTDETFPELMELVTFMNFSTPGGYWVMFVGEKWFEFRTVFISSYGKIHKEHFKKILKEFLEEGFDQYGYVSRLIEKGESFSELKSEFTVKRS